MAAPKILLMAIAALLAQQEGMAEFSRVVPLEKKGEVFTRKLKRVTANTRVKSVAVRLDWWSGPGDDRVGNAEKAVKRGFVFQVRHGKEWHDLPEVERDHALEARVEVPEGTFEGDSLKGAWEVRQKAGAEPVAAVSLEISWVAPWARGQAQPDLVVTAIMFDDLETWPPPEGTYPLKRDFPKLAVGKSYPARVRLGNRGFADARKPEVAMWITDLDGGKRTGLPGAAMSVHLREGDSIRLKWTFAVPKKLKPGLYLLHAEADPGRRLHEVDDENNHFQRVVELTAP